MKLMLLLHVLLVYVVISAIPAFCNADQKEERSISEGVDIEPGCNCFQFRKDFMVLSNHYVSERTAEMPFSS